MSDCPSLVVVGTVAIDSVKTPFGYRERVFGGSASYFSYAASFFTPVGLVAVVGEDFPEEYLDILKERKIDISHLEHAKGKTFFWKGEYRQDMNTAVTLETRLNVLLEFNPRLRFKNHPEYLFLANIDPVLQMKVLDQLERPRLRYVACDTMNYWIENRRKELQQVLARVDAVVLNEGEARQLTGEANLIRAGQRLRDMGPPQIMIKKGEHGVMFFEGNHFFVLPAYPLETIVDPTGAGDSFAGGMMGYLRSRGDLSFEGVKQAIAMGSMTASFVVESFGVESLRGIARTDIEARLALFRKMCRF